MHLSRALVIRLSSIGDVILVTPFLRALRRAHPACVIEVAVRAPFAPLLAHHPAADRLHVLPASPTMEDVRALRGELLRSDPPFDAVFDLHENIRSRILRRRLSPLVGVIDKRKLARLALVWLHQDIYRDDVPVADRYIECGAMFGLTPDDAPPDVHVPADIERAVAMRISADGVPADVPRIALCPGAKHFTKRWPEEHLRSLRDLVLARTDAHLLVLGGSEDAEPAAELADGADERVHRYCGSFSLLETAAALGTCDAAVSNDSGLMHLATARGVPVVALFGSTVRQFGFFPYHGTSHVLEVDGLACRPCTHIGRASCPKQHFKCMREIAPEAVFEAVAGMVG